MIFKDVFVSLYKSNRTSVWQAVFVLSVPKDLLNRRTSIVLLYSFSYSPRNVYNYFGGEFHPLQRNNIKFEMIPDRKCPREL